MANFTVTEICAATGGAVFGSAGSQEFSGVSTDTRTVKSGDLFVALKGERFDAHDFIEQAVQRGVTGVVVSRTDIGVPSGITTILVEDTLKALQDLARFHRRRFHIPIVAITGSNGKTTTKDMTAAVLGSRYSVLKTEGNFNNEIGLPLTLLKLTHNHQAAVIELGMRGRGEIAELADISEPTIGVVTNVGETHIELLGSLNNIAAAKSELVAAIPSNGIIILNGDNEYVRGMGSKANGQVIIYSVRRDGEVTATNIQADRTHTTFDCSYQGKTFTVLLPSLGLHNVYNALAAISVGFSLGLAEEEICRGLLHFRPSAMRQHIEQIGEYTVINDAYNASPLSMLSAIDTLCQVATGRKVAVLGDMLELGDIAIEAHLRIGRVLGENKIDCVVTVGELAKYIAQEAKEVEVEAEACDNHEQAQQALTRILRPGDTILIKGSRGMKMEQILKLFA